MPMARGMAAKFLSGWKKSNSDFDFSSDRDPQIAADFQDFPQNSQTTHWVLECWRVLKLYWLCWGGEPQLYCTV
jgi:hypothetical protein